MRSSLLVPLIGSAFVLLAFAPGCSAQESADLFAANDRAAGSAGGEEPTTAERTPQPNTGFSYRGSPLCRIVANAMDGTSPCNPDDLGTREDSACAQAVDSPTKACRLTQTPNGVAPTCTDASTGEEGAACTNGADCAAGYDCVDGPDGATCRRYCCSGRCEDHLSQNGSRTFCDIQKLFELTPQKAPVCMPIKACKLMTAGECAATETCAIVTETGDTGCVANGVAKAGESCDEEHCNVGLTCIGQPGSRRCYQLCRMSQSSGCGATQVCKTSAIFKDMSYGICK